MINVSISYVYVYYYLSYYYFFEIALSIDGEEGGRWGELHELTILWIQVFFLF